MNTAAKPQIVHESEAQRQHVRLPFPVKVDVNGRVYSSKNISSGGVSVQDIEGIFQPGQKLPVSVKIPFGTFSLDLHIESEVQHYDSKEKSLGLRFINLTTDQISLFNHVLRAFMAGDVIAAGDLLNVVSRDNFVRVRKQVGNPLTDSPYKKQLIGFAVIALLGLGAAAFIASNIYQSLFVVKAADAMVSSQSLALQSPASGTFTSQLEAGASLLEPGQVIGIINPSDDFSGPSTAIEIKSPCDCYIAEVNFADGDTVKTNEAVFTLIPADAQPIIIAEVEPLKAARISINTKAIIQIAGSRVEFSGYVTSIKSGMATGAAAGAGTFETGYIPRPVQVRIMPEQRIPADLTGRPARVAFTTN
jgi:mannuronan synthase